VAAGVDELEAGTPPSSRVRRPGGGRKRAAVQDPQLPVALLALVEPDERGDPQSPLRWTTKSLRHLAGELTRQGHPVGPDTVADLLRQAGFSLQGNAKILEGKRHPDRDAQFRYINEQAREHLTAGDPVISVDTKKKELVGDYHNKGRAWSPAGHPVPVLSHDFPDRDGNKAIPYGIYDVAANTGWVSVGTDHDTAAFAVATLRRWWDSYGRQRYPETRRLLITADAGGSNSVRGRAWKAELAAFAVDTGLHVSVCHFPPGTSKWNRIEHRLFSHISMNWRGRPLTSHDVIVNTIAATTTTTGLRVHAELDPGCYRAGATVDDATMAALPLNRHAWHGDWNYTLRPEPLTPASAPTPPPAPFAHLNPLFHPAITGLPDPAWHDLITQLTIPYQAHREAVRHTPRGHAQPRGRGRPGRVTLAHQLLITVLHDRYHTPRQIIADLFGVSLTPINVAIRHTRAILTKIRHTIAPADIRLTTLTELTTSARTAGIAIKPAS
jgi:hypothetical protein